MIALTACSLLVAAMPSNVCLVRCVLYSTSDKTQCCVGCMVTRYCLLVELMVRGMTE